MPDILRTVPGHFWQADDEEFGYPIDVGNLFTAPTGASAILLLDGVDVSTSNLRSSSSCPSISGSIVTTPSVVGLSPSQDYRLELLVEQSGEKKKCYLIITGTC